MASEWDRLYAEARRLHQQERLDDALALYSQVIGGNPGHGGAMHMLGLIAYQIGRTDTAVDLLSQAAVLDPLVGAVHSNLGLALMARGRMAAAETSLRRALLLSPQAETHASLGQLLLQQGKLEEALTNFRAALARNPNLGDAQAGLGESLWKLGHVREAEAAYEKAAQLSGGSETLGYLALFAADRRDAAAALTRIRQALQSGQTARTRRLCAETLCCLRWERDDVQARELLEQALGEGWSRPAMLLPAAASLVKLRRDAGGRPEDDTLLELMLVTAPNTDIELEQMLTGMRRQLLAQPEARDLDFTAALAQQCFLNEYVFAEEPGERDQAGALASKIEAELANDDPVSARELLAVACYLPLAGLKGTDTLLRRGWPDALMPVLLRQLEEPAEERALAAELPALTVVEDAVSRQVAAQYEQNPYPRWVRMEASEGASTVAAYLGRQFPAFAAAKLPLLPDMLFAGCGTGRFALELSQDYAAGSRLAIDLSRASLAYAARKARDAGIAIDFAQADILKLPETGKRFAMIESSGVLHHMARPFEGWKTLAACLVPGGVMRVSLYSALARKPVNAAREWIAGAGFAATPEGIRAARRRLIAERPAQAKLFLGAPDFFSVSECRDLLFHVREQQLTLTEIAAFLAESGLGFLGFETGEDALGAYRARFPGDPAATDLANWALFEADHPTLFAGMYQFWVQKP